MRHILTLIFGVRKTAILFMLCGLFATRNTALAGVPPQITVPPIGIGVSEGGIGLLTVTVSASTLLTFPTFKWRLNGQEVGSGLTVLAVNTLTVPSVRVTNAGLYTVEVRNSSGSVTSAPVSFNVILSVVTNIVSQVVTPVVKGLTTDGFRVVFNGPTGSNIVIQASSDLSAWSPISTNKAVNGSVDFTDSSATNRVSRFYRGVVQ